MLRHVVLFRWTDEADAAARAAIEVALATLPARISEISAYRFGADAGLAAGNWDFAVVADFRRPGRLRGLPRPPRSPCRDR